MALTVSEITRGHLGNKKAILSTVTFDSSYPTGGEFLTATDFGLSQVFAVFPESPAGYMVQYDRTNAKLKAFRVGAHSHVAFTVKGSEVAADKTAFVSVTEGDGTAQAGIGIAHAGGGADVPIDTAAATASSLAEVSATTDLSAVSVVVLAIGH